MAKMSWPYVAGFLDGEGCIFVRRDNKKKHGFIGITLAQTGDEGREVLQEMCAFFLEHGWTSYVSKGYFQKNDDRDGIRHLRKVYQLSTIKRSSVEGILRNTLPYLRVKKTLAQDALRYLILFPSLEGYAAVIRPRGSEWRGSRGSARSTAKLNEQAVVEIRKAVSDGVTMVSLARKYGVCRQLISDVARGKVWRHVKIAA